MKLLNINEEVEVILTPAGKDKMTNLALVGEEYFTEAEKSGKFQLWRLMQVFGPHVWHGMPEPFFYRNEIKLMEQR